MTTDLSRRAALALGAGMAVVGIRGSSAYAESDGTRLRATTRTIDVNGRAASVLGLLRDDGGHGIELGPNERFRVQLVNDLSEPTIIHWHGQIPPIMQDGVPDNPLPTLRSNEERRFDFPAYPGTHWMHAHIADQEMRLLAAPLIVRTAADMRADRQEVVLLLKDFTHTLLAEHVARLNREAAAAAQGRVQQGRTMPPMAGMPAAQPMAMDLNDIEFDAYLANYRTLSDPEVVRVEKSGRVLMRVINAASATVFRLDPGALPARVIAVDGQPIIPAAARGFALAMGQRADLLLEVPRDGGSFPVLALREGARQRTGIILATQGAPIVRVAAESEVDTAAYDARQEALLAAQQPLVVRPVARRLEVTLTGAMAPYVWSIDGRPWGQHRALGVKRGERVEIVMVNQTMMGHPMHLHGHHFQVTESGGRRIAGAMRDTVQVPPMGRVAVAFDGGESARWVFHCHHMLHLATGMMTELVVAA